jgi:hypothetical protein
VSEQGESQDGDDVCSPSSSSCACMRARVVVVNVAGEGASVWECVGSMRVHNTFCIHITQSPEDNVHTYHCPYFIDNDKTMRMEQCCDECNEDEEINNNF